MAHKLNVAEFGMFAIASSIYALLTGIARAAIVEPLLAVGTRIEDLDAACHRASFVGLAASVPMIAAGVLLHSPYIVATGLAGQGLTLYEFTRTVSLAVINPRKALTQDIIWSVSTVGIATAVGMGLVDGPQGYGIWAGVGALIGYGASLAARYPIFPRWSSSRITTTVATQFGADFLVGSGSAALTTNALGAFAGVSTVAALRAAGTMFGPVMLVVAVARTLAIPFLQQLRNRSDGSEIGVAVRMTVALLCIAIGPLIFIAFLPASIGILVLGQNWSGSKPLLPFLSLEVFLIVAATIPFAGHRVYLAGKATLLVRSALACLRMGCVVAAGVLAGAIAAAATMSCVALIGAVAWWLSYLGKVQSASQSIALTEIGDKS